MTEFLKPILSKDFDQYSTKELEQFYKERYSLMEQIIVELTALRQEIVDRKGIKYEEFEIDLSSDSKSNSKQLTLF